MDCIYLSCIKNECYCHAQPLRYKETLAWYKPTEEELKNCKNHEKWTSCPRLVAMSKSKP